jgi:predicted methyltransferase
MTYTVISHREVCGKTKGDTLTAKELQDAGISPETLAAGNHIKASNTAAQIPSIKTETEEGATK